MRGSQTAVLLLALAACSPFLSEPVWPASPDAAQPVAPDGGPVDAALPVAPDAGAPDAEPSDAAEPAMDAETPLDAGTPDGSPGGADAAPPDSATYTLPDDRAVIWRGNVGARSVGTRSACAADAGADTLTPSGGDDTAAIQGAIDSCSGKVVQLSAGTFKIGRQLWLRSNVTLRGAGMGLTILQGQASIASAGADAGVGTSLLAIRDDGSSPSAPIDLTGDLSKGVTTLNTASTHNWNAGDLLQIDQLNSPTTDPPVVSVGYNGSCYWCGRGSGSRSAGQFAKVKSVVDSRKVELELPLYWTYDAALSPQAMKIWSPVVAAGVEQLTVDNSASGSEKQSDNGTIAVWYSIESWLDRVEVIGSYKEAVVVNGAYRATIHGCKIHEGLPSTFGLPQYEYGRAGGIRIVMGSANLIEDCQLYRLRAGITLGGSAISGNVIAYNYVRDLYDLNPASAMTLAPFRFHGGHSMMNLLEGNQGTGVLLADNGWASSNHNTFFRNRTGMGAWGTGRWDVNLQRMHRYFTFVGNVLGDVGVEDRYDLKNVDCVVATDDAVFRLGYQSDGSCSATTNYDAAVESTLLRHANWDGFNDGTVFNGADARVLPASLYLTARPAWWGAVPWPAIGPDVTPKYPAARAAGAGTPWDP